MEPAFVHAVQTVDEPLRQGRAGTAVAVRVALMAVADHGGLEAWLGRVLQHVGQWFAAAPEQVFAQGGVLAGQICAQVRYCGGQTLLAMVGAPGDTPPTLELVVVGNRGILAWEGGAGNVAVHPAEAAGEPNAATRQLLACVRRSLETSVPVDVPDGSATAAVRPAPLGASGEEAVPSSSSSLKKTLPPYGVLLVTGAHSHQEMYGAALAKDGRCRIVGVTDEPQVDARRLELNRQFAVQLGVPYFDDLDAATRREDVHIVSVVATPERRAPIIVRAAAAGKHLYLDKPLAASMDEADQIVAAVRRAGIVSQMFSLVHSPVAERVRRAVASGQLGRLTSVHCDVFFAKGPAGTADLGRRRRETARPRSFETIEAKREWHNVGVYPLVLLRWLFRREARRVYATTGNFFFAEHQRHDMEDFAQATIEYEGGLIATISAGRTGWLSHPMAGVHRTLLVGTKGTATVDAYRPRVEAWVDELPWTAPRRHAEDPMGFWPSTTAAMSPTPKRAWLAASSETDARSFMDCIESGRPSDVSAADGAAVLEVILAAYVSAAERRVVELPLAR